MNKVILLSSTNRSYSSIVNRVLQGITILDNVLILAYSY